MRTAEDILKEKIDMTDPSVKLILEAMEEYALQLTPFENFDKEKEKKETKIVMTAKMYKHNFTDLVQILEYYKSIGGNNNYLMDGLINSINNNYKIYKEASKGGTFCG